MRLDDLEGMPTAETGDRPSLSSALHVSARMPFAPTSSNSVHPDDACTPRELERERGEYGSGMNIVPGDNKQMFLLTLCANDWAVRRRVVRGGGVNMWRSHVFGCPQESQIRQVSC